MAELHHATIYARQGKSYPALSKLVVLTGYELQDWVHQIHLVLVRRILAENDLMSTTEFDVLTSPTKVSA